MNISFGKAGLAACAVLGLALAACGGGDEGNDSPTPTVSVAETAPATPTSEAPTATATATPEPATATPEPKETVASNGAGGSGNSGSVPDDATPLVACGDILAPVDKQHRLGSDCAPGDLVVLPAEMSAGGQQLMRAQAASAFQELWNAARADGFTIFATSSYRSYQTQVVVFQGHVENSGYEYASRSSARAGHSEHQMGTTTDVTSESAGYGLESFSGTPEAQWIADNSYKFGFFVSYPPGTESITGYISEPWHIRYVGTGVAAQVRASGLTLHEFLLR